MAGYEKLAGLMSKHSEAELVHLEEELKESMREDLECTSRPRDASSSDLNSNGSGVGGGGEEEDIKNIETNSSKVDEKRPLSQSSDIKPETSSEEARKKSARDWYFLSNIDSSKSSTWEIMLRARSKLQEYNAAILQQTSLQTRDSPNTCDLDFLRRWFTDSRMGDFPLIGLDSNLWARSLPADLVALKARKAEDPLATLFLRRVFLWWHHCVGYRLKKPLDEEAQYFEYSDESILRVANVFSSVLSSGLLAGSVLALYFVDNMLLRLGIMSTFVLIFSLVLALATSAKKVDVFAATAAFAAVQVVFVGSTYVPGQ